MPVALREQQQRRHQQHLPLKMKGAAVIAPRHRRPADEWTMARPEVADARI